MVASLSLSVGCSIKANYITVEDNFVGSIKLYCCPSLLSLVFIEITRNPSNSKVATGINSNYLFNRNGNVVKFCHLVLKGAYTKSVQPK